MADANCSACWITGSEGAGAAPAMLVFTAEDLPAEVLRVVFPDCIVVMASPMAPDTRRPGGDSPFGKACFANSGPSAPRDTRPCLVLRNRPAPGQSCRKMR